MELKKQNWSKVDGLEFVAYLENFKNEARIEWTKKILNTQRPVLAIKTMEIKKIAKSIAEGNYLSFLKLQLDKYYENLAINGFLIAQIDDFEIMKNQLDQYVTQIDNWAHCDLLNFKVKKKERDFCNLAWEYRRSDQPFIRRVGLVMMFNFVNDDEYIDEVFKMMNSLNKEQHYYVNMINAWLVCECFIKRRTKTLDFFKNNNLNKFTLNKAISKCRDSQRVSREDKEMLLMFKQK